jgi:hypothetical protein
LTGFPIVLAVFQEDVAATNETVLAAAPGDTEYGDRQGVVYVFYFEWLID